MQFIEKFKSMINVAQAWAVLADIGYLTCLAPFVYTPTFFATCKLSSFPMFYVTMGVPHKRYSRNTSGAL
jgi:hypothetical protein